MYASRAELAITSVSLAHAISSIGEHRAAGCVTRIGAANDYLAAAVEEDFILQDLLYHYLHLVATANLDQRPRSGVQRDHSFLNQRRQFESTTHFIDDLFFFQFFMHDVIPFRLAPGQISRERFRNDLFHFADSLLQIVINDDEIVLIRLCQFVSSPFETTL